LFLLDGSNIRKQNLEPIAITLSRKNVPLCKENHSMMNSFYDACIPGLPEMPLVCL